MMLALSSHFRSRYFWRNLAVSVLVSIIAGHLIVAYDKPYSWLELWGMSRYYYSLALSSTAALIQIEFMHMVSRRLYRRFKDTGLGAKWFALQLLLGFGATVLLELAIATFLFHLHDRWILDTYFFRKLFLLVLMFIGMVNLFFVVFYYRKEPVVKVKVRSRLVSSHPSGLSVVEVPGGETALYRVNGHDCFAVSFKGEELVVKGTLDYWEGQLDRAVYFRGQREWMVHRSAIISVKRLGNKMLELDTAVKFGFKLLVSRRRTPHFLSWWNGEITEQSE
ncbi:LytTR family transcriptional regulator DNA-binding domain-containing protein [Pedobacter namyangjuensis]|uniref:LytTR family transcriptional regulator DNA-binding domain-containing protein n=1 Tax=Pedobacter namyangjuensis TaxID=600626 RepID=UPI000DE2C908|nr:LytTR family transcriptional regulator DNA-binding domain-containing protein [Pedobacter namyangjuensis]